MALNDPRRTIVVQFPPHLSRWVPSLPFVVFALWLVFTSWYTIPAESVGVLLRFGRFDAIREPGLHFKLPFGIDEILPVAVRRQLKMEFGFATSGATNPRQYQRRSGSGEKSWSPATSTPRSSNGWCSIASMTRSSFSSASATRRTRCAISPKSIMREVIGDRTVDEVITIGRQDIENSSLVRLREVVKELPTRHRGGSGAAQEHQPAARGAGVFQRSQQGEAGSGKHDEHRQR